MPVGDVVILVEWRSVDKANVAKNNSSIALLEKDEEKDRTEDDDKKSKLTDVS